MRSCAIVLKPTESAFHIQICYKTLNNFVITSGINSCFKKEQSDNFFSKFSHRYLFFQGVDHFPRIYGGFSKH